MKRLLRIARRFGLGRAIGLALLGALILLRIWDPGPLQEIRLRTFDLYQVIKPREATAKPVVIIDIDEESLAKYGQWPWPRTLVADLVQRLTRLGAIAIAFDIVFAEPDRMSPALAAEAFRGLDEETREKLKALPSNDQVLADAIRASRVVVGQSGLGAGATPSTGGADLPQTGFGMLGPDAAPFLITYPALLRNIAPLEQAAAGRGLFSILPEADGMVRRVPVVMRAEGAIVPSLTLDLLRVVTGGDSVLIKTDENGLEGVRLRGFELPTDARGRLWVHFSPHERSRYVSAKDVLDGSVPQDRIFRKLVLVGTSAVGLLDLKTTPVHPAMPGVEVHAQVLENALTRSTLSAPSYAGAIELLAAAFVSLAIIWFAPILSAINLLLLGAAVAACLVAASWYRYVHSGLLIDFTFPLIASSAVYLALVFTNYFREQVGRKRIRSAFSQYLSPALVEQLAQSPEKLVLGGEQRDMTILFSDVRGFTSVSELYKADPQGLTKLMNRLLTPLTNAIIDQKGTIDKYMGDAVMAFWNAPLDDAQHEVNACTAAMEMLARLERLNAERMAEAEASGQPFIPMNVGVGINTGSCVVGNMGSDLRFDYSVLGDPVNLASRLEGQTKSYGVSIIVGSKTADAVRARFAVLELDWITVKGKTEPEIVYSVLGRDDVAGSGAFAALHDLHGDMLRRYRARDWQGALGVIEACREAGRAFRLDTLYEIYTDRVRAFLETPPPDDWNGVFALQTK